MKKTILACMILGGCAAAPPPTGDASFDGRYVGTVSLVAPGSCGRPGGRIVMQVTNGAVSMPVLGGTGLVTAKVNPGGVISDASFSSAAWVGHSSGSGQITDGRVTLNLSTQDPNFSQPCTWRYEARKAA